MLEAGAADLGLGQRCPRPNRVPVYKPCDDDNIYRLWQYADVEQVVVAHTACRDGRVGHTFAAALAKRDRRRHDAAAGFASVDSADLVEKPARLAGGFAGGQPRQRASQPIMLGQSRSWLRLASLCGTNDASGNCRCKY